MAADDGEDEKDEKEKGASKMNAAKAFYRAMYAGEDVAPDDFGLTEGKQTQARSGGQQAVQTGPCQNCARLEAQVTEANAAKIEAENHYKRMAADFENYRRRIDREREEFQALGVSKAIESILPALDDMDRAKMSLANVTDPKAVIDSLNLVFTRFTKCLEGLGIKQLEVIGQPFDPRNHEPVQEVETNEFPDGVVVHELRRGYTFKDKVLRPSLVNVSSNPSGVVVPKAAPEPAAKPEEAASEPVPAAGEAKEAEKAPESEKKAEPAETASTDKGNDIEETPKKGKSGDVLKKFTSGTATSELPVFQMDEAESLILSPEEMEPEPEPKKKKKLDESVFDLGDVSKHE